jgi:hypothetical protein
MFRNLVSSIASAILLCTATLVPLSAEGPWHTDTKELHPFTHEAYIPADTDVSTIRFEKARAVLVPTTLRSTSDSSYCAQLAFRDPGGSAFCPSVRKDSPVAAYEVTYSFDGRPGGDDSGLRKATFQVWFRPEELTAQAREAISAGKHNRSKMAEYFALNTYRENMRRSVIDESQSRFCEGNFIDGNWKRDNSRCADRIRYTTVVRPSDRLTVRVNPPAGMFSAKR